ncbi:interferon alpha-13-like [Polyodon spathula]|uniref:interferon alpha-13-like n=1 Tax=Polyodon spathula TaxID=7913 RepID=UPI001B7E4070|nr:interferon alpha-13-like [Polyodon spathula]
MLESVFLSARIPQSRSEKSNGWQNGFKQHILVDVFFASTSSVKTETTALIAYNVLSHVLRLFDETLTPVSWDLSKLRHFKNTLFRQTEKLEECMEGQTPFVGVLNSFADRSELLKTYFENMENVLKDKGGNFPVQCKKENVAIAVPLDAYEITEDSQIEDIKMTIYEVLNDVNKIFLSGPKPASWNKTNLDNFHNNLHRQIHGVKQCVQVRAGAPQGSHLVLKAYFKKLQNVLQDKDYSFCAWEIVRKEAVNTLTQVQLLMDKAEIE